METAQRTRINAQTIMSWVLLLILSGVFIFSAITKLVAIDPFEWIFVDMGIPSTIAAFLARFFIGFEFLLGLFLLAHFYLRRFTYPATIAFLVLLTIYLLFVLIHKGNNGDCGCFGDTLPMSPLLGIIKNLGLILLCYVLRIIYPAKPYKYQPTLATVVAIIALSIPFLFVPFSQKKAPINLDVLYKDSTNRPSIELRKGKHVIAFMSLGCPHCRTAAKLFKTFYDKDSTTPVFMVLNGLPDQSADFFRDTKAEKVPHLLFNGMNDFLRLAGPYVPAIYWVNNGIKERKISYTKLDVISINDWAKR
jgi:hypothetical protein